MKNTVEIIINKSFFNLVDIKINYDYQHFHFIEIKKDGSIEIEEISTYTKMNISQVDINYIVKYSDNTIEMNKILHYNFLKEIFKGIIGL